MGKAFGNYEILRKIATGGMAELFLAKQRSVGGFERLVCIKRILPHLSEQDEFVKMFQDEARIVANLTHPNVAQIYDIGKADDAYYIAMEYVRGEDLRRVYNQEVARGRAMPLLPAAHIAMGAAAGLEFAHRQTGLDGRALGIVHRDVSPQNVLVTYDGHVKLVDFGVAKAEGKLNETRSGVLKGKYSYMSPEQAAGDPVDGRTDIFALGITLYEITTGVRLFKRDNEIDTLHAVIDCQVTAPRALLPDYDPDLEAVVLRALAHDVDERYQTAGELERDLERYLLEHHHPPTASTLATYMRELFAEKLADELLFGGQPWEENLTPDRPHDTRALSPSRRARASDPQWPDTSAESVPEDTVIDADTVDRKSHGNTPWALPDGWETHGGSGSRTHTHDDERSGEARAPQAPLRPVHVRRLGLLPAAAIATLLIGGAVMAGLVITSRRPDPRSLPRSGMLVFDSEPRGARVVFLGPGSESLNQRYDGHRTPFTLAEGLTVGHALRARIWKDGFAVMEVDLPKVTSGSVPPPVFVELSPGAEGAELGSLIVLSTPSGAEVYIDGNQVKGLTPLSDVRVRGGQAHKVEVRLKGFAPRWETVHVEPGSRRFIEMTLVAETQTGGGAANAALEGDGAGTTNDPAPPGGSSFLSVSAPMKLKVTVDNRYVGDTPVHRLAVDPGLRRVRLHSESDGFTLRRKLYLAPGKTETIDVKPAKGTLSLNATPWAWVRLGEQSPSETPVRLTVFEGEYNVVFECPDGHRKKESTRVAAGQTTSLSIACRD